MVQSSFHTSAYGWLMLAGILVSIAFWRRQAGRDSRLLFVYAGALAGALFGAKLVYIAAEGWLHYRDPNRWIVLGTGKSILGALLGGYAGVEIAKRFTGYSQPTGDLFAIVAPVGIMIGRVGCVLNGCCLGRVCKDAWWALGGPNPRWPAAQMEFLFNLLALIVLLVLRRNGVLKNQLFHVYLMTYGIFRLFHEFWRETPPLIGSVAGYQIASVLVALLGLVGFVLRAAAARTIAAPISPGGPADAQRNVLL